MLDVYELLKDGYEIFDYARQVDDAIRDGKEPPGTPAKYTDHIETMLNAQSTALLKAARKIAETVITLDLSGINIGDLSNPDLAVRRRAVSEISVRLDRASSALLDHQTNVGCLLESLEHVDALIGLVRDAMRKIEGFKILHEPVGYLYLDLDRIRGSLGDTRATLSGDIETARSGSRAAALALENAGFNTVEFALRGEFDALYQLDSSLNTEFRDILVAESDLRDKQHTVSDAVAVIDDLKSDAAQLRIQVSSLETQIVQNVDRLNTARQRGDRADDEYDRLFESRDSVCPNRHPWPDCTHTKLKNDHLANEDQARSERDEARKNARDLDERRTELVARKGELQRRLIDTDRQLAIQQDRVRELSEAILSEFKKLAARRSEYLSTKARVEAYLRQNSVDERMVRLAIRSLRGIR